eukprot:GHVQ01002386.1.p1 GENE.GHVQ01002386.1~~GHVQ01002386.1.p1  ORF type:complete len:897 (-),score=116.63 GHVQ01002386.1:232-2922(-)
MAIASSCPNLNLIHKHHPHHRHSSNSAVPVICSPSSTNFGCQAKLVLSPVCLDIRQGYPLTNYPNKHGLPLSPYRPPQHTQQRHSSLVPSSFGRAPAAACGRSYWPPRFSGSVSIGGEVCVGGQMDGVRIIRYPQPQNIGGGRNNGIRTGSVKNCNRSCNTGYNFTDCNRVTKLPNTYPVGQTVFRSAVDSSRPHSITSSTVADRPASCRRSPASTTAHTTNYTAISSTFQQTSAPCSSSSAMDSSCVSSSGLSVSTSTCMLAGTPGTTASTTCTGSKNSSKNNRSNRCFIPCTNIAKTGSQHTVTDVSELSSHVATAVSDCSALSAPSTSPSTQGTGPRLFRSSATPESSELTSVVSSCGASPGIQKQRSHKKRNRRRSSTENCQSLDVSKSSFRQRGGTPVSSDAATDSTVSSCPTKTAAACSSLTSDITSDTIDSAGVTVSSNGTPLVKAIHVAVRRRRGINGNSNKKGSHRSVVETVECQRADERVEVRNGCSSRIAVGKRGISTSCIGAHGGATSYSYRGSTSSDSICQGDITTVISKQSSIASLKKPFSVPEQQQSCNKVSLRKSTVLCTGVTHLTSRHSSLSPELSASSPPLLDHVTHSGSQDGVTTASRNSVLALLCASPRLPSPTASNTYISSVGGIRRIPSSQQALSDGTSSGMLGNSSDLPALRHSSSASLVSTPAAPSASDILVRFFDSFSGIRGSDTSKHQLSLRCTVSPAMDVASSRTRLGLAGSASACSAISGSVSSVRHGRITSSASSSVSSTVISQRHSPILRTSSVIGTSSMLKSSTISISNGDEKEIISTSKSAASYAAQQQLSCDPATATSTQQSVLLPQLHSSPAPKSHSSTSILTNASSSLSNTGSVVFAQPSYMVAPDPMRVPIPEDQLWKVL